MSLVILGYDVTGGTLPIGIAVLVVLLTALGMAVATTGLNCFCFHPGAVLGDSFKRAGLQKDPDQDPQEPPGQRHLSPEEVQKFLAIGTRLPEDSYPSSFRPKTLEPSAILAGDEVASISAAVPPRFRLRHWQLLYSSGKHGTSLQTLYRRADNSPTVLIVRDLQGCCFGCFATEEWKVRPRFFGTGESFVFRLVPEPQRVRASGQQPQQGLHGEAVTSISRRVEVWHWWRQRMGVERNDYFQYTDSGKLAIGGCGAHAIRLGADLMSGSSGECRTYGSACLAGSEEFEVGKVELWALIDHV